jgi:hypothetical protein
MHSRLVQVCHRGVEHMAVPTAVCRLPLLDAQSLVLQHYGNH